jgi:hypothetical protein
MGAAAGRDGDGVDAPGETLRLKIHHGNESRYRNFTVSESEI